MPLSLSLHYLICSFYIYKYIKQPPLLAEAWRIYSLRLLRLCKIVSSTHTFPLTLHTKSKWLLGKKPSQPHSKKLVLSSTSSPAETQRRASQVHFLYVHKSKSSPQYFFTTVDTTCCCCDWCRSDVALITIRDYQLLWKEGGKCCVSRIKSTFHLMFIYLFGMIAGQENRAMDLHGEVMACAYEDVQVMWSILDKSKSSTCNITSWYMYFTAQQQQKKRKPPTQLQQSATSNSICWVMRYIGVMFLVILALYLFGSGMQLHHFVNKWYSGLTSIFFKNGSKMKEMLLWWWGILVQCPFEAGGTFSFFLFLGQEVVSFRESPWQMNITVRLLMEIQFFIFIFFSYLQYLLACYFPDHLLIFLDDFFMFSLEWKIFIECRSVCPHALVLYVKI